MARKIYRLEHKGQIHLMEAGSHQQAKMNFMLEFGPNTKYNWKTLRLHKIERNKIMVNHFIRHVSNRASYVAAKTSLIKEVGVIDQISKFSYISNTRETIYLDEDVDFKIFGEAYNKMFGRYPKVFKSQNATQPWIGESSYDEFTMETLNGPKAKASSKQPAPPAPRACVERPKRSKPLSGALLSRGLSQKALTKKR